MSFIEESIKRFRELKVRYFDGAVAVLPLGNAERLAVEAHLKSELERCQKSVREESVAESILSLFSYEDWNNEGDGSVHVGDFVDLFFEANDGGGYRENHIKGVIVLDKYADFGKTLPIILLENGSSVPPQTAWEDASVSRIQSTQELIDALVEQSSFNDYPEFQALKPPTHAEEEKESEKYV